MNQASCLLARWDTRLSGKSKDNLPDASGELRSMHPVLAKGADAGLPEKQKSRLAKAAQRVSAIFSEENGSTAKRKEVGDR